MLGRHNVPRCNSGSYLRRLACPIAALRRFWFCVTEAPWGVQRNDRGIAQWLSPSASYTPWGSGTDWVNCDVCVSRGIYCQSIGALRGTDLATSQERRVNQHGSVHGLRAETTVSLSTACGPPKRCAVVSANTTLRSGSAADSIGSPVPAAGWREKGCDGVAAGNPTARACALTRSRKPRS